ncbi:MAG: CRISP-associated protein Cas1 [Methanolobus sp.]|jgi:CRISPR-associated protein Cas1|nr:CRISP-associated protein Cas1 [Methanolobus sp.]MDK2911872.1 CRISP-associated protein Cas1 [Methanolobus sp.]MDN5310571.1 CRISP-associated protein Cas1 [Methanolobus sp.]
MTEMTPQTLHISGYGKKLKKHNEMLAVEWNEEDEKKSLLLTPSTLEHLIISGEHMISTGAMRLIVDNDIALSLLDWFGNPVGYLFSHEQGRQLDTWEKQLMLDPAHAAGIARSICIAAAENKISVLLSLQKRRDVNFHEQIRQMKDAIAIMSEIEDVPVLMGHEGRVSNAYFSALKEVIPDYLQFAGRIKHPSPDPVNVMLSYGYGILYSKIRFALMKTNLNPYYGVLHSRYRKQEALVYDLIEEFRQAVVDKTILTMIGRKQVSIKDFSMEGNLCVMQDDLKKEFSTAVLSRLAGNTQYECADVEINEIIQRQAVALRNAIVNGTPYKAYKYQWRRS